MENQNNREAKQNWEGRWFYKETETSRNGNSYDNFYKSNSARSTREESSCSSCSEEEYNRA